MRKGIVILMLLSALVLCACGGAPEAEPSPSVPTATVQAPAPTETPRPTETPMPEAPSPTAEPTATTVPEEPSPTPEPTSTTQPAATPVPTEPTEPTATPTIGPVVVFRDDFEGALAGGWSWQNEDPSRWNLTDVPGALRVILQDGGINWSIPARNVLLRQAPTGKFEIATLVHFTPSSNFQIAGLLVYQDESNMLQLGRAFCDGPAACVGNGIYFDSAVSGEGSAQNFSTNVASQSTAYLKVRREGGTYTGYYSEDGTNWTVIGQHTNPLNPVRVGLIAAQATQAETTADFEYFTITTLP